MSETVRLKYVGAKLSTIRCANVFGPLAVKPGDEFDFPAEWFYALKKRKTPVQVVGGSAKVVKPTRAPVAVVTEADESDEFDDEDEDAAEGESEGSKPPPPSEPQAEGGAPVKRGRGRPRKNA